MAYDEDLADRIRVVLQHVDGVTEKKMFGGHAFLVGGHMVVAAGSAGGLLLRCDPAQTESHVRDPDVGRYVMRDKEMDGWLRVDASAVSTDEELAGWVEVGRAYVSGLPPK
jgi:TfoX/Sxy family transcriptional regulator of competence genes